MSLLYLAITIAVIYGVSWVAHEHYSKWWAPPTVAVAVGAFIFSFGYFLRTVMFPTV